MSNSKRHVVSFLALALFAAMALGSGKPDGSKPGTTETTSSNLGDGLVGLPFTVGDAEWTIIDVVDRGSRMKPSFPTDDATTAGRFIQVHFKVHNKSSTEGFFVGMPKIIDDKSREFGHYSNDSAYLPADAQSLLIAKIPPSMTKEFYQLFEVPNDADGLKLKALDFGLGAKSKRASLGTIPKAPPPPPKVAEPAAKAPAAKPAKAPAAKPKK